MKMSIMKSLDSIGLRRPLGLGAVLASIAGGYLLHRLGRRWGATDEEVAAALPGDDLVPMPTVETTHAVTIAAPAAAVWPWLVQMGYGRAGWYTDAWWYRQVDHYLWHVETPRPDRIVPEWQHLAMGDVVPDGPPDTAFFTVAAFDPLHTLALYSTTHATVWLPRALRDNPRLGLHGEVGWVFVLSELGPVRTRLILRSRVAVGPALYRVIAAALFPPADLLVAPMMLTRIRQRVEQAAARGQQEQASGVQGRVQESERATGLR